MNDTELKEESQKLLEKQREYLKLDRQWLEKEEQRRGRRLTSCVVTFGCQMNARDSEKLRGILEEIGFENTDDEHADLVIYNTCTVRENANTRVYGRLGHLHNYKDHNPGMLIGLCGCMMQEPEIVETIRDKFRFVDFVFGTYNVFALAEILYSRIKSGSQVIDIWDHTKAIVEDLPTDRKYSFKSGVNITYGCDNFCTYCIVPYVRGREKSRTPEDIVGECCRLSKDGVREVMLLGQNVNSYGKGLDHPITFPQLLTRVEEIPGIDRIRFMTPHPKDFSDELIEVMSRSKKICNHVHLPLQSGSSRLLQRMNRHYTKESYLDLVRRIREGIPDVSLTTDIIVGFPGETEEDFHDTLDVVRKARFDSAFTFLYSKRHGTPAASMEQVPEAVAKERFSRLLKVVDETAAAENGRYVGREEEVLVEQINEHDPKLVTGRMTNNLLVHFPGDASLIGQIVPVRLVCSKGFYYLGERA
ncbi:MAG: tRNA (N6-isopentenyl adenosine(37)-C2)-methylthiotransferase MiaB [Lachnospiraceae bacterium]|jgi:tRNA-2-methylthio-N6-dimethylallyladenosine synthase